MTTTATIQSDILKELGVDPTSNLMLARCLRWINKTLDKLQGYIPEAEFMQKSEVSLTTVADQATYAMPNDFIQLLTLRDDDNATVIEIITREEFDRRHTDPSSETTGNPSECTLEFDRNAGRSVLRLYPIPDDAYTMYAIMRVWHPDLSSSQDLVWSKLRTTIEEGAIYHGAKALYKDPEYTNYRQELRQEWLDSVENISRLFAIQKPKPRQIPIQMRKNNWNTL